MDYTKLILALIVAVAVFFLIKGDFSGDSPLFGVTPSEGQMMDIRTDISCTTNQDCINAAAGVPDDPQIRCDVNICVVTVRQVVVGGSP